VSKTYFESVDSFEFQRLYGSEKYSLQNMLLKQTNMPTWSEPGDEINELWSDRFYTEWSLALKLIQSRDTGDSFFHGATDESFLKFAAKAVALVNSKTFQFRCKELIEQHPLPEDAYAEICKRNDTARDQAASEVEPAEITGAVIVRYTNAMSGYPCLRLTTIKAVGTSRQIGISVTEPPRRLADIYGRW
jgi:hypothetical protein